MRLRFLPVLLCLPLKALAQEPAAEPWRVAGTVIGSVSPTVIIENPAGMQRRLHIGEALDDCTIGGIAARGLLLDCAGARRWRGLQHDSRLLSVSRAMAPGVALLPDRVFRELLNQPQRLVLEVSLNPRVRNGHMDGYAVERLKPGGLLEGQGLMAGDVIVAVNGSPVSEPQGFMRTLGQLAGAPDFLLQLEHDGVSRDLQVRLR